MTLALDTATVTGWAIRPHGSLVVSGTMDFQHDAKRESPGMRFLRFSKWLYGMIEDHGVTLIVFEQSHQRGGAATTVSVGLTTHLMSVCADRCIEHQSVHSRELKKFATGKGNAPKEEMLRLARLRWGPHVSDDNEADALWLLAYSEERA